MEILSTEFFFSLIALTCMEVLLGIDNVIFVSIVASKLQKSDAKRANLIWMIVGIIMRLSLLIFLSAILQKEAALFSFFEHPVSLKDIIMIAGGSFLLVNTTLEIHNKLEGEEEHGQIVKKSNFASIMTKIILIDLIFSIDGIVTAIGMANVLYVQVIAVVIAMIFMFIFTPKISAFIHKHPTFKMLALSFLILIAVLLVVEGIHVEKIQMPKGYIYFAMAFSFGVEIMNTIIRKKSNPVVLRGSEEYENMDEQLSGN